MGIVGQEEDSSSPSGKLTVVSVVKRGAGRGRVKVTLSDGSSFSLRAEIQQKAGIFAGEECSEELLRSSVEESERCDAEQKALSLLSYAPHSREGLRLKLIDRGIGEKAVSHALNRMVEAGYLNDLKYAEEWIRSRLRRHPEGRWALMAGLVKRGVRRETAEQALSSVDDEKEIQAARRALEKISRDRSLPKAKAAARLSARGFNLALIHRVLDDYPD